MFNSKKYQNKKIAIYGMGKTGQSASISFKKLGAQVFCWDDDEKVRNKVKKIRFKFKKFWLEEKKIDKIVVSPGIDISKCKLRRYLKKNINKIITDLDLFFELNKNAKVISITGTNGKSTTCKIIEKILREANYNVKTVGNIGNPILSLNRLKKKQIFILEVSSYQLQYSKLFRSKYAAILNISTDHLERHKNIKNYIKVKSKLFFLQNSSDYSYINLKNKYSRIIKNIFKNKKLKSKLIEVEKSNFNYLLKRIKNQYFDNKGNIENLAFALEIAKKFKIKDKIIVKALNKFKGLPHRQEIIFTNKNITCINDSKATSFDASLQSLSSYNKIFWIVGGLPKYKDNFYLRNVKKKIIKAYIIGKSTYFFKKQIKNYAPYTVSKNISKAVDDVYKDLRLKQNSKGTILFSPAAASFDQFSNFENRGNYFKKVISRKFNFRKNA